MNEKSFQPDINHRIWQAVADIPAGKVSTYGAVARSAGLGGAARRVGAALRGLPNDTRIPWHRVINAQGKISLAPGSDAYARQRSRLEREGIRFTSSGRVDLKKQGW